MRDLGSLKICVNLIFLVKSDLNVLPLTTIKLKHTKSHVRYTIYILYRNMHNAVCIYFSTCLLFQSLKKNAKNKEGKLIKL